ncbi:hypothetical protein CDA64_01157 [Lactobacillus helveticus]|nr:hypothetical protein [Lactobacillus helveticus]POO31059.1 hypothetical protein CDA64_01157 [Lactobacillus helveticus]
MRRRSVFRRKHRLKHELQVGLREQLNERSYQDMVKRGQDSLKIQNVACIMRFIIEQVLIL